MKSGHTHPIAPCLACVLLPVVLAGCGSKGIVGKWAGTIPVAGQTVPMAVEFKADGTEEQTATIMGHSMLVRSTYTAKDDTMSATITSATLDGKAIPQMPAPGEAKSFTYKLDGDTLTLTSAGKPPVVLKRADK